MQNLTPCPSDVPAQWSPAETKLSRIRDVVRSSMPPITRLLMIYEIIEHGPGVAQKLMG
jgi:hypothetical protein